MNGSHGKQKRLNAIQTASVTPHLAIWPSDRVSALELSARSLGRRVETNDQSAAIQLELTLQKCRFVHQLSITRV
jgi:hypothetical protein